MSRLELLTLTDNELAALAQVVGARVQAGAPMHDFLDNVRHEQEARRAWRALRPV